MPPRVMTSEGEIISGGRFGGHTRFSRDHRRPRLDRLLHHSHVVNIRGKELAAQGQAAGGALRHTAGPDGPYPASR